LPYDVAAPIIVFDLAIASEIATPLTPFAYALPLARLVA
jgi:hypothetical protein